MASKRVGGIIELKANGSVYSAKGSFTINMGRPKRDSVVGHDRVHGYKELPQPGFFEGVVTDSPELSLEQLVNMKDATITLKTATDKIYVMRDGIFTGDGTLTTEEGEIAVRWDGNIDEVR